jgi:hypothetical protein
VTDPDFRDPNVDRAYRETPRDEPSPELDERIRAAARRAVGTRPQSLEQHAADGKRRSWASRWRVPLSVAATVVIAATLSVMVQEEERRPRDDAGPGVRALKVAPREAERPAPAGTPEAAARSATPAPAPAAQPPSARSPEPDAAAARVPESPDPAPTATMTRALPRAEPEPKREERAVEAQQPAAAEPTPVARGQLEMPRQAPAPAASPPLAAPAPAPLPAPRPAAKPVPQTAPSGAASESLRRDRTLGDRPERAARDSSAIRSPEAWIDHIRSLRAQGREAEATAELAEFRRAYPDFKLPTDLAR